MRVILVLVSLTLFLSDVHANDAPISGLPILVYHQIRTPARNEPWNESITIDLAVFKQQMRYLHDQGYTTLDMQDVTDYLAGKSFPDKIVALQFDDGWKSQQDAVPILNRYGFKATFWIIAGAPHDAYSPHMSWDEIRGLAHNAHFDFYSHTMTHPWKQGQTLVDWITHPAAGADEKRALWEITESKRVLEAELTRSVPYLAWPKGFYNARLIQLAKKAGYTALVTIDEGLNYPGDNPFRLRRIMINGHCDPEVFPQILREGNYRTCH